VIADGAHDDMSVYEATFIRQHDPPADIVIPARAPSVLNVDAATHLTARDRHVQLIAEKGRMGWQKATGHCLRSLAEITIGRYKHILGPKLLGRLSSGQQGEVAIAIQILNRMIRIARATSICPG